MPRISPEAIERFKSGFASVFGKVLGALVAGFIAWWVTASTNAEMAVQQQEMQVINQFDESGATLDGAVSVYIDGLIDGRDASSLRGSLHTAIALHAAKSQRMAGMVSETTIDGYTAGLGKLNTVVDGTDDLQSGMTVAQLHAQILANKRVISDTAWEKASEE